LEDYYLALHTEVQYSHHRIDELGDVMTALSGSGRASCLMMEAEKQCGIALNVLSQELGAPLDIEIDSDDFDWICNVIETAVVNSREAWAELDSQLENMSQLSSDDEEEQDDSDDMSVDEDFVPAYDSEGNVNPAFNRYEIPVEAQKYIRCLPPVRMGAICCNNNQDSIGMLGASNSKGDGPFHCVNCGTLGHSRADCTQNNNNSAGFCGFCGMPGHTKNKCPQMKCNTCGKIGHYSKTCKAKKQKESAVGRRFAKKADLIGASLAEEAAVVASSKDIVIDALAEVKEIRTELKEKKSNDKLRPHMLAVPSDFEIRYDDEDYKVPEKSFLVTLTFWFGWAHILWGLFTMSSTLLCIGTGLYLYCLLATIFHYVTVADAEWPKKLKYGVYFSHYLNPSDVDLRADAVAVADVKHMDPQIWVVDVVTMVDPPAWKIKRLKQSSTVVRLFLWVIGVYDWAKSRFLDDIRVHTRKQVSIELLSQILTGMGTDPFLEIKDLAKRLHLYAATSHTVNLSRYEVLYGTELINATVDIAVLMCQRGRMERNLFGNFLYAPVTRL
jgi:hypothetical protein